MDKINVLVSLHKGYGLGDAVQMSAVLRHAKKYRSHWNMDFQAEAGREKVGRGIADNIIVYGEPYPRSHYDAEVLICLYDTWANWGDRPNTRVSSALHEHFGLPWDAECGRYQINVTPDAAAKAGWLVPRKSGQIRGTVAVHYRGDSSPEQKNLSHAEGAAIADCVRRRGYHTLFMDWRNQWPIPTKTCILSTGTMAYSRDWGRDAEMNAAVISKCDAFIGIDSGPGKVASATNTPALIVWTGHHPAPFHDPAPNTTHLVPIGYHGLKPVCNDRGVIEWFERHYNVMFYNNDPVQQIDRWLSGVLK